MQTLFVFDNKIQTKTTIVFYFSKRGENKKQQRIVAV